METKSDHDTILSPNPFTKIPGSWIRKDEYDKMKKYFKEVDKYVDNTPNLKNKKQWRRK